MTGVPQPAGTDRLTGPILVIDDIPSLRAIYQSCLAEAGYRPIGAKSAAEGLDLFHRSGAEVVILDLFLPDREGLDLMREMLSLRPSTAVIVVTADQSIDRAVAAMRAGARDFLVKPVSEERLLNAIAQAVRPADQPETAADHAAALREPGFIGDSPAVRELNACLRAAAGQGGPVFIWGAEGTGRTLAARTIHSLPPDAEATPFVVVDCAFPGGENSGRTLFFDAVQRAAGGTLFLNHVTEMAPDLQSHLARMLRDGLSARVIAAATRPPAEAESLGEMNSALATQFAQATIRVPTLCERREDIVPLARTYLRRCAAQQNRRMRTITPPAEEILRAQDWPGNVRQLINVISAITTLHDGESLTSAMLPVEWRPKENAPSAFSDLVAGMTLAEIEKIAIEHAIARHDGIIPRAAEELGVAPSTIYRKMGIWRKD